MVRTHAGLVSGHHDAARERGVVGTGRRGARDGVVDRDRGMRVPRSGRNVRRAVSPEISEANKSVPVIEIRISSSWIVTVAAWAFESIR